MSERDYPGTTVNFLLATKVVGTLFSENLPELKSVNTKWTPIFASELNNRIDLLAAEYLGVNVRNALFRTSGELNTATKLAKDDVVTIRKNLMVDFKKSPEFNAIMTDLGLNISNVHTLSQSKFIALLSQFKRGLTPSMLAKITAGGMPEALPNRIAASATSIINLNNEQEKLKNSVKEASSKMNAELSLLYKDIIKICLLASDFYKKNPVKKRMFSFTATLKSLGETKTTVKKEKKQAAA